MMNAEQLSRIGEKLVKRCGSRDPFEIARRLGILAPIGAEGINLWCATNPTAPWRSWHGRVPPFIFGIYRL